MMIYTRAIEFKLVMVNGIIKGNYFSNKSDTKIISGIAA
jgi:hypothetical protein